MTTNEMQEKQPDALARLERKAREYGAHGLVQDPCLALISEARKEMEELRETLEASRAVCRNLSGRSSEALRMGQQQGRAELAQELIAMMEDKNTKGSDIVAFIRSIVSEDAGQ